MYSGSRAAACSRAARPARHAASGAVVAAGGGDDVADQPLVPGSVLADDHRGLGHPRAGGQHRLDLARLDPEPADLHLLIGPAAEHQLPVGRPPGQVPGPVHPLPGPAERARDEPLRGQPRPAQVTARQPGPGHVQLPGHPGRHRAEPPVQHEHPGVGDRDADRRRRRPAGPGGAPRAAVAHTVSPSARTRCASTGRGAAQPRAPAPAAAPRPPASTRSPAQRPARARPAPPATTPGSPA